MWEESWSQEVHGRNSMVDEIYNNHVDDVGDMIVLVWVLLPASNPQLKSNIS
jgi:hypothetical protein